MINDDFSEEETPLKCHGKEPFPISRFEKNEFCAIYLIDWLNTTDREDHHEVRPAGSMNLESSGNLTRHKYDSDTHRSNPKILIEMLISE